MHAQSFIRQDANSHHLLCAGEWVLSNLAQLNRELKKISLPAQGDVIIDGQAISKMDSAGAWLLGNWIKKIEKQGLHLRLQRLAEQFQKLLTLVEEQLADTSKVPVIKKLHWVARIGKMTVQQLVEGVEFLNFIGKLALETLTLVRHPGRMRWNALAGVIYSTGYQALPIIALLSFMIGIVIAYQMGLQLRTYGANIYIVELVGLSVLREFGPLITAIMVAGRTGSAFTAQLGTMKINQEIDALNTMGVTPGELLILPRLLGLFIALPLLTMWADMFGVMGGMLMAATSLDVTAYDFLYRFEMQIPLRTFIIGLGKSLVFSMLIASIGCFQGMQVRGSADSVGKQTTRSVVLAIFFIIVADAIFSVIFSKLHL